MAITDPSDDIIAYLTDEAREMYARTFIGQIVYQTVGFSVGRGGFDPTDPVHIVSIDTTQQTLLDQVYPDVTGYAAFQDIQEPTNTNLVFECRLPNTLVPSNADYGLGEVGIWAQVLVSNDPSEVGEVFLFAIAHMPIRAKTHRDAWLFRVSVQY
jgi:hypothetical protein